MKAIFLCAALLSVVVPLSANAQSLEVDTTANTRNIYGVQTTSDGDTIPYLELPEIFFYKRPIFKNRRQEKRYNKLIRDVKIVLPFAKLAGKTLNEVNAEFEHITNKKERRKLIKARQKVLMGKYEKNLRKFTFSQGKLLIKLVDRECGENLYTLIKEYKSGSSAFFWQGVAFVFAGGASLKTEYDPMGDDALIEQVVLQVEKGLL